MSDFLTRLVQRSLGSVPTVQPRIPSYFVQGNELGGPVISGFDESGGAPIKIDGEIEARQDSGPGFEVHRSSFERRDAADAGPGGAIDYPAAIGRKSDQASGDAARRAHRSAKATGGLGGFLKRLFKPKTAEVVQLKQELSDGPAVIRPEVTSHSPHRGKAASHQPERRAGLSEATAANPAQAMPATQSRAGSSPLPPASVSASRHAAERKGVPLSQDTVPTLPEIQRSDPLGGPQDFAESNIVSDTIELAGPGNAIEHSAQQAPLSERVDERSTRQAVFPAKDEPAIQIPLRRVHEEKKTASTQVKRQDEADPQAPPVTALHQETEAAGLPQANAAKAISARVMAPETPESQWVREEGPPGIEASRQEPSRIEVAIDRIEVRAAAPTVRPGQSRRGPALSLAEYLNRRGRRQR